MNIETKGSLRILTPKLGHILRHKESDTYSEKVYLGKNASVDDYEEIMKKGIEPALYNAINGLIEENEMLITILEQAINE